MSMSSWESHVGCIHQMHITAQNSDLVETYVCFVGARETIIDVIGTPASKEDFPGLFGVPFKCITYGFVSSNRILMTSQWRSSTQVVQYAN